MKVPVSLIAMALVAFLATQFLELRRGDRYLDRAQMHLEMMQDMQKLGEELSMPVHDYTTDVCEAPRPNAGQCKKTRPERLSFVVWSSL